MSTEEAKAAARRRWDLTNERNLDGYDEILAEDFVHHGPGYDFRGRQAYVEHLKVVIHGYPDVRLTIQEVTGNDRWVATICTLTARQQNPVPWAPNPTGEPQVARLVTVHAIEDGRIVEEWIVQEWRAAGAADA